MRQGDFRAALTLYKALLEERPQEERILARVATLEENLQPMELMHPKAAAGGQGPTQLSELQEAEAAANRGDTARAVACYERIVAATPENELAHDRLRELRATLPSSPSVSSQPQLDPTPSGPVAADRPSGSSPESFLKLLLTRVMARRRR